MVMTTSQQPAEQLFNPLQSLTELTLPNLLQHNNFEEFTVDDFTSIYY
jgi:hypothetical protein